MLQEIGCKLLISLTQILDANVHSDSVFLLCKLSLGKKKKSLIIWYADSNGIRAIQWLCLK